jgi:endonuclease/exonuclease/phosphatase family metal-dependent hydrolase
MRAHACTTGLGALGAGLWLALAQAPPAAAMPEAAPDAAAPEAPRQRDFVVLSFNVKSLPLIGGEERQRRIGRILAGRRARGDEPDVVLLQEAFSRASGRIRARAGYRYQVVGAGGDTSLLLANPSGLEILSDHPILAQYGRRFDDCGFPDCLVAKAVVGATLEIPGLPLPLRIFNTHLQADGEHDPVRKNQIDDIEIFLRRIGFGAEPAIFAGDVNFKPRHKSYWKFLRELSFFTETGRHCLASRATCEIEVGRDGRTDESDVWQSSHDRQYFYAPAGSGLRIEPVRLIRNMTERVEGERLSDHWGYEVRYRLSW